MCLLPYNLCVNLYTTLKQTATESDAGNETQLRIPYVSKPSVLDCSGLHWSGLVWSFYSPKLSIQSLKRTNAL